MRAETNGWLAGIHIAVAVHAEMCGCSRGFRIHGRKYKELGVAAARHLAALGFAIDVPDTF